MTLEDTILKFGFYGARTYEDAKRLADELRGEADLDDEDNPIELGDGGPSI